MCTRVCVCVHVFGVKRGLLYEYTPSYRGHTPTVDVPVFKMPYRGDFASFLGVLHCNFSFVEPVPFWTLLNGPCYTHENWHHLCVIHSLSPLSPVVLYNTDHHVVGLMLGRIQYGWKEREGGGVSQERLEPKTTWNLLLYSAQICYTNTLWSVSTLWRYRTDQPNLE